MAVSALDAGQKRQAGVIDLNSGPSSARSQCAGCSPAAIRKSSGALRSVRAGSPPPQAATCHQNEHKASQEYLDQEAHGNSSAARGLAVRNEHVITRRYNIRNPIWSPMNPPLAQLSGICRRSFRRRFDRTSQLWRCCRRTANCQSRTVIVPLTHLALSKPAEKKQSPSCKSIHQ